MKYYGIGFAALVASAALMDSNNFAIPIVAMAIGIILIVIGGLHEQRIINQVDGIEADAHDYFERIKHEEHREN